MKTSILFTFLIIFFHATFSYAAETTPTSSKSNINNNQRVFVGIPDLIEDGDSFWIGIHKVRLFGVDAPESKQMCGKIHCGRKARDFLKNIAPNTAFTCTLHEGKYGKPWVMYGRYVVTCTAGSININEEMVKQGWAVASEKPHGRNFRHLQTLAKVNKRGIHLTNFITPKSYRQKKRGKKRGNTVCVDDNDYIPTSSPHLPISKPRVDHFPPKKADHK